MCPSTSGGGLVAGFTLDQLKKALADNVMAVNRFVDSSLRSTSSGGELSCAHAELSSLPQVESTALCPVVQAQGSDK